SGRRRRPPARSSTRGCRSTSPTRTSAPTSRRCRDRRGDRGLALPQRLDQVPLPHLRAAGDVPLLRQLVELLAVAVLERGGGRTAATTPLLRLLDEAPPRPLGHVGDRALPRRRRLRLLHVALRGLDLLPRCHSRHLLVEAVPGSPQN